MRTRFAPSPTGLLHVGGLRTALYTWLLARQSNGTFILRIEDTDQEREVPGAVQNIVESLQWAGITIDEGAYLDGGVVAQRGDRGPYIQSQRTDIYREHADRLLQSGHAYRCFCSPQRLEEMRERQVARKQPPMYDRTCLRLSRDESDKKAAAGEPYVVRLQVPDNRTVDVIDLVRGPLEFKSHTIDDQVLLKSDGFPTYHLANVVDDHLMGVELVVRGEEWLSSLPKHILLYEAFGWAPPQFAHLSLLLNRDKTKLSKRQGSVSVQDYRDKGYLPEVMVNFLALLGWNPGTTQELFTLKELQEAFSLDRVQKAGAIFDLEKLDWLQGQWIRRLPEDDFVARCLDVVVQHHPEAKTDEHFRERALLIRERITFFHEAHDMLSYFYSDPQPTVELMANAKQKVTPEQLPEILDALLEMLAQDDVWSNDQMLAAAKAMIEKKGWKLGQLLWPLRAALTGREYSPGATEVAIALGKETTLRRLKAARQLV